MEYTPDSGSPTITLLETKVLINSVISDSNQGARFACCDIKDFFLASPMSSPEFMKIHRRYIPIDICQRYNLDRLFHKCLLSDRQRYVWPETGRDFSIQTIMRTIETSRIQTNPRISRNVRTRDKKNKVLSLHR